MLGNARQIRFNNANRCQEVPEMNAGDVSVFDLTPSEKLQLVEDLWDDLAANPLDVPVLDWQKEELDRRMERLQKNPASAIAWEEVKRRVRSCHGR